MRLGDTILRLSSISVTLLAYKAIEFGKKTQGHRGWYQSKVRMRLPISD